jgi:nucleoside-diphosphate-sugar epimerase
MAHYLVTGGAGFIGSHLVEELVRRGERVRVVDNLVTGHRENLSSVWGGIEFIEGDLAEAGVAAAAAAGVDYVLHQAAIPSVPRSVAEPVFCHRANVEATLNLLVAARDAGVRRLVFAGSSSVYGNISTLPTHEELPVDPLTPYALQKLMGEQYLKLFTALYGLATVSTRYFNVFGPRQDPSSPYSGVISVFIRALLDGRPPTIHGDGEQTRDFTYVANVVDGVLKACHADGIAGQVINVATGGRVSLNALFAALQSLTGAAMVPVHGPARTGDVRHSQADITRARRLLGYAPTVGFDEGLAQTLDWARQSQR